MPKQTAEDVLRGAFELTDAIRPFLENTRTAIQALPEDDVEGRTALEQKFLCDVYAATHANEQDIRIAVRIRQEANTEGRSAALVAAEVWAQLG